MGGSQRIKKYLLIIYSFILIFGTYSDHEIVQNDDRQHLYRIDKEVQQSEDGHGGHNHKRLNFESEISVELKGFLGLSHVQIFNMAVRRRRCKKKKKFKMIKSVYLLDFLNRLNFFQILLS